MKKAQEIEPSIKLSDLEVVKKANLRQKKLAIVYEEKSLSFKSIGGVDQRPRVLIRVPEGKYSVDSFSQFLESLLNSIFIQGNLKLNSEASSQAVFDFSEYIGLFENKYSAFQAKWNSDNSTKQ